MKSFSLLILLGLLFFSFNDHPIFISMAEIDYKEKEKRIEIAIKIYSDDLQKVLSQEEKQMIEIATDREHPQATAYITQYLKKNFKLYSANKQLSWEYVGRELDQEEAFALWIFLKVDKVKRLKGLKLYNNILIDYRASQVNKISFRKNKDRYKKFDSYKDHQINQLF